MTPHLHARFLALHTASQPLLLTNAWDAASARLWQELGAPAVATSSAAVAWSRGYADGGALPQSELLSSLAGIVRVTSIPVTADIEDGYSDDPRVVAALVAEIAAAGAVGINIEDGASAPDALVAKIRAIRAALRDAPFFINARTDVYLRGMASDDAAVAMTIERLRMYRDAGADGGFVPGLASVTDAANIAAGIAPLLLNVMALPGLPPAAELQAAGVRRISTGPYLFKVAFGAAKQATQGFLEGDYAPMFEQALDYNAMNRMFEVN
ncbi:MAG: isocitrate lyase/phosphoenolpyruvate mutase family protein [Lysobacter sp.]|nr:isocitrate lyase/phosphoenolpyruvate mutase family protein [Lysobacter sp.]